MPLKIDIEIIGDPKFSSFLEKKIRRILNDPTVTIRKTISHNTYGTQPPARRREFNRSRLQSFLPEGFTPRRLPYEQFFSNVDSEGKQEGKASNKLYHLEWSWGIFRIYFCYMWVKYSIAEPGWHWVNYRRVEVGMCDDRRGAVEQCFNMCKPIVDRWVREDLPIDLRGWEPVNNLTAVLAGPDQDDYRPVGKPGKKWKLIL